MKKVHLTPEQYEEIAIRAIAYCKAKKCNENNPAMLLSFHHHPSISEQCTRLMKEYFDTEQELIKYVESVGITI